MDNRVSSLRFQKSFQLVLHERAKQFVPDLYRKNAGEHIFIGEVEQRVLSRRVLNIYFDSYFFNFLFAIFSQQSPIRLTPAKIFETYTRNFLRSRFLSFDKRNLISFQEFFSKLINLGLENN